MPASSMYAIHGKVHNVGGKACCIIYYLSSAACMCLPQPMRGVRRIKSIRNMVSTGRRRPIVGWCGETQQRYMRVRDFIHRLASPTRTSTRAYGSRQLIGGLRYCRPAPCWQLRLNGWRHPRTPMTSYFEYTPRTRRGVRGVPHGCREET